MPTINKIAQDLLTRIASRIDVCEAGTFRHPQWLHKGPDLVKGQQRFLVLFSHISEQD
jgi:hypothetical protein